mmetsp:Transcript_3898/g.5895  ORF Transcript_3898/g.5895 Transcript_3898/m.5895 type:complete len:101 (-) Transcript_3898:516-818(-)
MLRSSSWAPVSTTIPSFTTQIISALRIVDNLCAITIVVLEPLPRRRSRASCTTYSLSLSSAEVASSRRRIFGFFKRVRAIAIRCFCPPDNCAPLSPTCVS